MKISFLVFEYARIRDLVNDKFMMIEDMIAPISVPKEIINISSPFGLNSKELFLNIEYQGLVANKIT
jgi:hypothetical protein